MNEPFVNINDFRKKLEEYLLYADHPVVITRRRMPVGYFIPAKVWYGRGDTENLHRLVTVTLEAAGYSEKDVDESIEEFIQVSAESIRKRLEHE